MYEQGKEAVNRVRKEGVSGATLQHGIDTGKQLVSQGQSMYRKMRRG